MHIIEARNLTGVDEAGTSDPFVRIKVGNLPSQVTDVKQASK